MQKCSNLSNLTQRASSFLVTNKATHQKILLILPWRTTGGKCQHVVNEIRMKDIELQQNNARKRPKNALAAFMPQSIPFKWNIFSGQDLIHNVVVAFFHETSALHLHILAFQANEKLIWLSLAFATKYSCTGFSWLLLHWNSNPWRISGEKPIARTTDGDSSYLWQVTTQTATEE